MCFKLQDHNKILKNCNPSCIARYGLFKQKRYKFLLIE